MSKALDKFAGTKKETLGLAHKIVNRNTLAKKLFPKDNKGLHRLDKARLEKYRTKTNLKNS